MKAAETNLFESMLFRMCSVAHNKASVVEKFSRKSNCEGLKRLCFLRIDVFAPSKLFQRSSIFDNAQVIEIAL